MKFQAITLLVGQLACLTTANPVSRTTTVTYQAENAQLNGVQVETKYNGYTGKFTRWLILQVSVKSNTNNS